jgi:methyl-accepting chemotaxis protein
MEKRMLKAIKWLKNLKIGQKLIFAFSFMILLIIVIGATGYNSVKKINGNLEEIFAVRLPSIDYLIEADRDLQQLLVAERSAIFANAKSEVFQELVADYEENLQQSEDRWNKYKSLVITEEEQAIIPGYEKAREEWKLVSRRVLDGRIADTRQGRREALDLTLTEAKAKFENMRDYLDKLTQINLRNASKANQEAADIYKKTLLTLFSIIGIGLFCGIVLAIVISRGITRPLSGAVKGLQDIAEGEGDLTNRLEVVSSDEVGELATWFNTFMEKLQGIIREITGNAGTLNEASGDLTNLSDQMSQGADNMSTRSNTVASSATEMSANMSSVSAAMDQTTTNINIVATSAEEMTATINEIAQNSEKARHITGEAVSRSQDATEMVKELGNSADNIGKITEAITEISEQTNLLALNATIEAARAGEAGKGFTVVANEIKELARQTANATQEISNSVTDIQESTSNTVMVITENSKVINEVNEIVSTIASAVEEQSVTTKEIASNVAQASKGLEEVNQNVSQSSEVSEEIARDISEVNQSSGDISNSSSQVKLSAEELRKLSEKLNVLVGRFKV